MQRGPPCPRNCNERATCNGDATCPLYEEAATQFGEGSEEFCRFLLRKWPFHPNSRFATMNVFCREYPQGEIPDTVPLPPLATDQGAEECSWSERLVLLSELRLHGRSPL